MGKLFAILFTITLVACNVSGPTFNPPIQPGTYAGTFTIVFSVGTDSAYTRESHALFVFSDSGSYTCGGGIFLPGGGRYEVANDSLYLTDDWMRVAIWDWTQVLEGPFYYVVEGGKLMMTQRDSRLNRYRSLELVRQ